MGRAEFLSSWSGGIVLCRNASVLHSEGNEGWTL